LGLPHKKTSAAFYQVPTYSVFYALLTQLDGAAFAAHLEAWLQAHAEDLPQALAMDAPMIRAHLGRLTRAQSADARPPAGAHADQKEGVPRAEQIR
jgi:hypothetical protein